MNAEERQTWLERRRTGLGGTDIAKIIVNAAPHEARAGSYKGSLFSMWAEKVGLNLRTDHEMPAYAKRGLMLESYVCHLYEEAVGPIEMWEPGLIEHPVCPLVRGTPDRMVKCKTTGAEWGMDAKTRRSRRGWGEDGSSLVPLDTEIQMRVYMEVCDKPHWDVATLFGLDDFRVYRLHRDEYMGRDIIHIAQVWWEQHVVKEVPPEADSATGTKELLAKLHRDPTIELRESTQEERELHERLLAVRAKHKKLSEEKAALENQMRAKIGDDLGITGIATWKPQKAAKVIDSARLKSEAPEIYEKFSKERNHSRTLRIIGD
jgi:predicted phage-related endonuclease|tara:strand:+ start:132 stop:1088 length:957 start_codon:yes stop_codon:yes gene_type:complete